MPFEIQALTSPIKAKAEAAGGTLGAGSFLRTVIDQLRTLGVQQIDTEEERDAIKDALLVLADVIVAPRFPKLLWTPTRAGLDATLDKYMDYLPALLAG